MIMDNLQVPCIMDDWYYNSDYDLGSAIENMATPQDCQAKCQQESLCYFWTHSAGKKECYLANEQAYQSQGADSNHKAGPKKCPIESDCFYHDVV